MRKTRSQYEHGRSDDLLKVKARQEDAEALVLGVKDNLISLQMPKGTIFQIPKAISTIPLQKGDIITIAYNSFVRSKIPIDPVVVCKREDLNWDDVVRSSTKETPVNFAANLKDKKNTKFAMTPRKRKKARETLVKFAMKQNLDPLQPSTWYQLGDISKKLDFPKDVQNISYKFHHSLKLAAVYLFPEIGLEETKFLRVPSGYWSDVQNRRNYFLEFAKEYKFDPLVANNWYNFTMVYFEGRKHSGIRGFYDGDFARALLHVFPDIGLDPVKLYTHWSKFIWQNKMPIEDLLSTVVPINLQPQTQFLDTVHSLFPKLRQSYPDEFWDSAENRRKFFIEFAKRKGFDFLVPENWYRTKYKEFKTQGKGLLKYHNGFKQALAELFPDIGLITHRKPQRTKERRPNAYWTNEKNGREFFIEFAKRKGFDPLKSENWSKITHREIFKQGGKPLLLYHQNSTLQALRDLFPELSISKKKSAPNRHTSYHWSSAENRKKFFIEFAKQKGFDPLKPENWSNVKYKDILDQGGGRVVKYHASYKQAVMDLFHIGQVPSSRHPGSYWRSEENRRNFFIEFAKKHGFDPLVPENWDKVQHKEVKEQGGAGLLVYYKGYYEALTHLFPNIGLVKRAKHVKNTVSFWKIPANRRKFFIEFAKKKRFDPLLPENWYNIKQKEILEKGRSVLYYYANYRQAIAESFPEISTLSFLLSQLLFSPRYCRFFAKYKSNRTISA